MTRRFFLPDVKAVWYIRDVSKDVGRLYSLWSVGVGRQQSRRARKRFGEFSTDEMARLHPEHVADAKRYARRMKHSKRLPPILIDRRGGQDVVWDGNRRCLGYIIAGAPEDVTIPAYLIERRVKVVRTC